MSVSSSWDVSSDAELITAVRSGESAAFGVLYERHLGAARAVAGQYSNSAADADDSVAEAFSRVFTTIQSGGGPDVAFRAYLFTVVRRVALQRVDAGKRTQVTDDLSELEAAFGASGATEEATFEGFERGVVSRAYRSLPERWQAVLWYTEVEQLSPAEIGPVLGLSANGVAALAYRAREGLRQAYLQQHLSEPAGEACTIINSKLGSYVRGGLAKRETALVEAHLDECGHCRALVLELGDVNHGMRVIIAPLVLGGIALGVLHGVGFGGAVGAGAVAGAGLGAGGATVGAGAGAGSGTGVGAGSGSGAGVGAGSGATAAAGSGAGSASLVGAGAGGFAASGAAAGVAAVAAVGAGQAAAGSTGGSTAGGSTGAGSTAGATTTGTAASGAAAGAGAGAGATGLAGLVAGLPIGVVGVAAAGIIVVGAVGVAGMLGVFSGESEPIEVAAPAPEPTDPVPGDDGDADDDGTGADDADPGTTDDGTGEPTDPTTIPPLTPPGLVDPPAGPATPPTDPATPPTTPPDPTTPPTVPPTVPPTTPPDPTTPPTTPPDPPPAPANLAFDVDMSDVSFTTGSPQLLQVGVTNDGGQSTDEVVTELIFPLGSDVEVVALPEVPSGGGFTVPVPSKDWECTTVSTSAAVVGRCILPDLPPDSSSTLLAQVLLNDDEVDGEDSLSVGVRTWAPALGDAPDPSETMVKVTSPPARIVLSDATWLPDLPLPALVGRNGGVASAAVTIPVSNEGGTSVPVDVALAGIPEGVAVSAAGPWVCAGDSSPVCTLRDAKGEVTTLQRGAAEDLVLTLADSDTLVDVNRTVMVRASGPDGASSSFALFVKSAPAHYALDVAQPSGSLGAPIPLDIVVANDGRTTGEDVTVALTLPENVLWTPGGDWAQCPDGGERSVCSAPVTLPPGEDVGLPRLTVIAPSGRVATGSHDVAYVVTDGTGTATSGSFVVAVTQAETEAELAVSVPPTTAMTLREVNQVTFQVSNVGGSPARGVTASVTMPQSMRFEGVAAGSSWSCENASGTNTTFPCTLGDLAAGADAPLELRFNPRGTAVDGERITATISATGLSDVTRWTTISLTSPPAVAATCEILVNGAYVPAEPSQCSVSVAEQNSWEWPVQHVQYRTTLQNMSSQDVRWRVTFDFTDDSVFPWVPRGFNGLGAPTANAWNAQLADGCAGMPDALRVVGKPGSSDVLRAGRSVVFDFQIVREPSPYLPWGQNYYFCAP